MTQSQIANQKPAYWPAELGRVLATVFLLTDSPFAVIPGSLRDQEQ